MDYTDVKSALSGVGGDWWDISSVGPNHEPCQLFHLYFADGAGALNWVGVIDSARTVEMHEWNHAENAYELGSSATGAAPRKPRGDR